MVLLTLVQGITTVMGDLDDSEKIQGLARNADIVFHTATADHIPSAQAILDGVKERAAEGRLRCDSDFTFSLTHVQENKQSTFTRVGLVCSAMALLVMLAKQRLIQILPQPTSMP